MSLQYGLLEIVNSKKKKKLRIAENTSAPISDVNRVYNTR